MAPEVSRRDFLSQIGLTVGTAAAAVPLIGGPSLVGKAEAQAPPPQPKGTIPTTPYKVGHMTFHTGAAAVLGEPMYKGHILAAEEINAKGGLLGKRKIETIKADENAGTDANV
jgi:branched-chain amino acid transport system substrate-binding protein